MNPFRFPILRLAAAAALYFLPGFSAAQHYYRDIVIARETESTITKYREAGVYTATLTSREANGMETEGFIGSRSINKKYTQMITTTASPVSGSSELTTRFDDNGRLIHTFDTTDGSSSETRFYYDDGGQIQKISNVSRSEGGAQATEDHLWTYNAQGYPLQMTKVRNGYDTAHVRFSTDENGRVTEERLVRNGKASSPYYYYYDEAGRLTDIVSYNDRARRLLPLYIFEYDQSGRMQSMIVVPEGSDDYQRWVYQYGENGLKSRESVFNKRKQLLGSVAYTYH